MMRARELSRWSQGAPDGPALLIPLGQGLLGEGWPDPAALAPGERVGAMLFGSMERTLPDGREEPWVIAWKGSGAVRLEGPYVVREEGREAHRVEVFVDPTLGNGNSPLDKPGAIAVLDAVLQALPAQPDSQPDSAPPPS